jgi:SpoVK/Ycf46/Vps4 family AAA+-type ATPase
MPIVVEIEEVDCPEVYDPVCDAPHAYVSAGLVSHNCIALFDEVEKIFAVKDFSGSSVTTSMMSQVLWWMAERQSRVLVVMTTNARSKMPDELYREGRIDEVMTFHGFSEIEDALTFADYVLKGFDFDESIKDKASSTVKDALPKMMKQTSSKGAVSHAQINKAVTEAIKQAVIAA